MSLFRRLLPRRWRSRFTRPLTADETQIRARLVKHLDVVVDLIGERNWRRPDALASAATYIRRTWAEQGYPVGEQQYPAGEWGTFTNLDAELPAPTPRAGNPAEVLIVGAHYDSVMLCPGANDNGTGIAAVLEIAHQLRRRARDGWTPRRTVRFVAFANEEPPFFQTPFMGSRVYARRCRERGENIVGMLTPETIGYYSDAPGSQRYPLRLPSPLKQLFHLFYPRRGNFIGFVCDFRSARWLRRCVRAFRRHSDFPARSLAAPGNLPGIGFSDHWSFWQEGYRALMVTDTAPFRYAHYHCATDTKDKIDYERTARVVAGLAGMVADLAG